MVRSAHLWRRPTSREWLALAGGLSALAALTLVYRSLLGVVNPTVVTLSFLLVVLFVSAGGTLRVAIATSVAAVLTANYFFLPPFGTLSLEDPTDWVALFVFLVVSAVATRLSVAARERATEAWTHRDELARLFDLSRDVLLTTDSHGALDALARHISRRFTLEHVAICLPGADQWRIHPSATGTTLGRDDLDMAQATARGALEFDAATRTYGGHRPVVSAEGSPVQLTPIRIGPRAIGLLATAGRPIEPGTLDAIAGLTAIAVERSALLDARQEAERARHGAELKSALLSSISHDLRTPLTAITVAADNLRAGFGDEPQQREQLGIVMTEVRRLNHLFENIVQMARLDTGTVEASPEWVHTGEIIEAAVQQAERALGEHPLEIVAHEADRVFIDPRLASSALAHLLENAGAYSDAGLPITVAADISGRDLRVVVRDRGPGLTPRDLPRLFERFYRGDCAGRQAFGTGMGLSIARGLLAAQGGRVWGENHPDGGAVFTMVIPTSSGAPAAGGHA